MEESIREFEISLAIVRYVDLCQHDDIDEEWFWVEGNLKELEVVGYCLELPDVVKVMWERDCSHKEECSGIVIPVECVKQIIWLKEDKQVVETSGASA